MLAAVDIGLIYGLMALGVYMTFRILNFADLTVDGSFVTGAAVAASGILGGVPPLVATFFGFLTGCVAGVITGLLNTKGKIDPLLAGILTQIALYSLNLRIMGKANLALLRSNTLLSGMRDAGWFATGFSVAIFGVVVLVAAAALVWFLGTNVGLGMQAAGNNPTMARSQGVHTTWMIILGLSLSNGLVAVSGALMAQYQGFADISMGIGTIVIGLASVILGQAIIGHKPVWRGILAALFGSVLYRFVIQVALDVNIGLQPSDMKIISAVLVIAALLLPKLPVFQSMARNRHEREIAKQVLAADVAAARKSAGEIQ
ncbi:MAG: ABC transporter permease [Micrococcales bacterium]|nr:ABC transporter permease [Micrococcales bacterium]